MHNDIGIQMKGSKEKIMNNRIKTYLLGVY